MNALHEDLVTAILCQEAGDVRSILDECARYPTTEIISIILTLLLANLEGFTFSYDFDDGWSYDED